MRVLALVPYPYDQAPGQRYRIEQWAALLEQTGVELTYEPFRREELHSLLAKPGNTMRKIWLTAKESARRLKVLGMIKKYDLIYIYKEVALLGPALIERCISMKGVPVVFDMDDAIFLHSPSYSPVSRYFRWMKFPGKTRTICTLASHVIVGNAYLADYASRFNQNVTIIPSTIDTVKYTLGDAKPDREPLVIGWSGSYSTVQHLNTVRRVLMRLAEKDNFRVRVIGTSDYKIDGVDVETIPWRSETEVADLRPLDIGIMPLPDDEWARGKCGFKALQYMALGIPTVCSPVGVNSKIIHDEENGLLAATEDEWIDKLTRLLHSRSLRERLGEAGRATVEAGYAMPMHAARVYQVFKSMVQLAETGAHNTSLSINDPGPTADSLPRP